MNIESKQRTPIPPDLAGEVLFQHDHTCCVCREKGRSVQIHHIDEDPSNHSCENLAVLCLEHHEQTHIRGGFGRKLLADEATQYRDDWLARVKSRRREADRIAAMKMTGIDTPPATTREEATALKIPADQALVAYVEGLPVALAKAYEKAQPLFDSGVTAQMIQGNYDVIDVVVQMWCHLATWFPEKQFGGKPAEKYFSEFVSLRFEWHRALAEPEGVGKGGTIVGVMAGGSVLADVEQAVEETVQALLADTEGFSFRNWQARLQSAGNQ